MHEIQKVKNLGAVIACCAILIDAELYGTMIDNRNHNPKACDLLHERSSCNCSARNG